MSRSYKAPYWTDNSGKKKRKNRANRKVRKFDKTLASGSAYKKVHESWDICDFSFYDPKSKKVRRK